MGRVEKREKYEEDRERGTQQVSEWGGLRREINMKRIEREELGG